MKELSAVIGLLVRSSAVATLLSCFYGHDVSEGEVLWLAQQYEIAAGRDWGGVSALSLKRALAEHGVPVPVLW